MNTYITKSVKFNLDDAHQRVMYEWCMSQSTNFSGFVKDIIVAYRSSGSAHQGLRNITPPETDLPMAVEASLPSAPSRPELKKILSIF